MLRSSRKCRTIPLMFAGTLVPLIIYLNNGVPDMTISDRVDAHLTKRQEKKTEATRKCDGAEHLMTRCDLRNDEDSTRSNNSSRCEVIHVCMICAGYDAVRDASTVIKSLLFHRTNPLHLHFIADKVSLSILETLLKTWDVPSVQYSLYSAPLIFNDASWVPKSDSSVDYNLMKLQLPYILPPSANRVILLDTKVILSINIVKLWRHFTEFQPTQMLGLAENLPDSHLLSSQVNRWPKHNQGYHTGMMLMMLDQMRDINWAKTWREIVYKYSPVFGAPRLPDQDVINAIIKGFDGLIVYTLPCAWSFQMAIQSAFTDSCYSTVQVLHIISQLQQQVHSGSHRDNFVSDFSKVYTKFVQYNGNLLQTKSLTAICDQAKSNVTSESHVTKSLIPYEPAKSSACSKIKGLMQGSQGRLHLYYIAYNYTVQAGDVTLVSQLSFDRLGMLERLCQAWAGPMSLTFYLSDSQAQQLVYLVRSSSIISSRRNIGYHIVFKNGAHYPINYMRNVALNNSLTSYVFLADIDFVPMNKTYEYVRKAAVQYNIHDNKIALVVPAFEATKSKFDFPTNKDELKKLVDRGQVDIFTKVSSPTSHSTTNYPRWYNASKLYQVHWKSRYEPYVVASKDIVPRYDERFVDYGRNKISHIIELDAQGFQMQVHPYAFTIHMPHAKSSSNFLFLRNPVYKRCLAALDIEFNEYLSKKYGDAARKYRIKKP